MSNSELSESDKGGDKPAKTWGKIQRSVESMLKQMEISNEEIKYRMENFYNVDLGKEYIKYLKCTKCNKNFQKIINRGEAVGIHPLLGVLMCDSCCDYYGDGNFSLDSEGEDKYCRWCGEGGTIFACSKCICGFCEACIEKHFGADGLEAVINDDDWVCYFCNPKPLWCLRSICFLAKEASNNKKELLMRKKERGNVKKKRKKKENEESGSNNSSSGDYRSSSSSSNKFLRKRKRLSRLKEKIKRDKSSSSEDEKENHVDSKKKLLKNKTLSVDMEKIPESDTKNSKKEFEVEFIDNKDFLSKKTLVLEKLKSIWKLTQIISEVGLNSSRERLRILSKTCNFKTLELLKKEHDKLKSCMHILLSSLNTASNSVDSIKEDLTFDSAKDEKEIFQTEETKLKRFAEKCQEESNIQSSVDSDGDSVQNELEMKKRKEKRPTSRKENSMRDSEKVDKRGESDISVEKERKEGKDKSISVFSDSGSENKEEKESAHKNEESRDSGKEIGSVKPLLKVKSFARMLEENVYDKNKVIENKNENNPVIIDLYNVDTDESDGESEKIKGEIINSRTLATDANKSLGNDQNMQKNCLDDQERKKKSEEDQKNFSNANDEKREEYFNEETKKMKTYLWGRNGRQSTDSWEEENGENKDYVTDESEMKEDFYPEKRLSSRHKKLIDGENEQSKRSEKTKEESKKRKKCSPKGDRKNEEKNELSEKVQEKKISSNDKAINERKLRNSFRDDSSNLSEEDQKNTRKTRSHDKEKTKLKASFEKYKRLRERFLNLKAKFQLKSDKDEVKTTKVLESSDSEIEKNENELKIEKQRKKRILASSDEENEKSTRETKSSDAEKFEKGNQNQKSDLKWMKHSSGETSSDNERNNKRLKRVIRKKRKSRISDSSEEKAEKERKKRKENSSESSEGEVKTKKKGRRRNIKKILRKDFLQLETKEALKNEEERKKRIKEREKMFKELFHQDKEDSPKQIILDFDPETKEPLVKIHKKLVRKLKPHQIQGVRFMWDNCFESVQKMEEESGSGCILAHCMGLGKTLQVITLVHTVMTHDLGVNSVLIICPLNTVSNWIHEFEMWLENVHTDPITLFDLIKYKKIEERRFHLEDWHNNGGVLVLSYDLFRNLTKELYTKKGKKKKDKSQQFFEKMLLDPGPDLVICDEGHLLKNEDTALSKSVSRIKTLRRIVLTGTPLQNNLIEYHCMVQFVKPNLLGTRKEFFNRFVNPINNGQFEDSTDLDVKIMKRRSHVLHSMLDGCIQRFDYSVLTSFLPEKYEYVLSISLTEAQAKAYIHFIKNLSAKSSGSSRVASLFNDYHNLQRIWTHPRTLLMHIKRERQKEILGHDSEGSLKDFIESNDEEMNKSDCEDSDSRVQKIEPRKRTLRSSTKNLEMKKIVEESENIHEKHWWDGFFHEKAYDDLRESNKLVLLFSLLKFCEEARDKVLIFSQSLYSLDLIEYFLNKVNDNNKKGNEMLCGHRDTWVLGCDYFRLDGSSRSELRTIWCKYFNEESNTRARLFLISTKAGGLGINLCGANRVVIFDASWNPSHDLQSIFRVYRFGQKKICYIYRFLSEATMEEKIYERQVTKLSLSHRVVDEHQIERHYSMGNLQELYNFEPTPRDRRKVPKLPKDSVLADLLANHKDIIVRYHEHDSLLENKQEEELSEEERKAAWKEYEEEKIQKTFNIGPTMQHQMMLMQQAQFSQGTMTKSFNSLTPAYLTQINSSQNFLSPMGIPSNIPFDTLLRGMRVGVTPLPDENVESYLSRIFSRENWLVAGQQEI